MITVRSPTTLWNDRKTLHVNMTCIYTIKYDTQSMSIKLVFVWWILDTSKFQMPFFSGQSLLLSTTVLNDSEVKGPLRS